MLSLIDVSLSNWNIKYAISLLGSSCMAVLDG